MHPEYGINNINIQMKFYVNAPTIYPTIRYRHLDSKLWGQLQFIFNLFQLWSFQRYSLIAAVIVATAESSPCSVTPSASARASNEGSRRFPENFTITEKAPVRAISWLKAPTSAFTFKTLLRHYAKQVLTPRSLNVKLGPRRKGHKGRAGWLA